MTLHIIIPVRPPEEGKTRLASALQPQARAALVEHMFRHVLSVATSATRPDCCLVVSRSAALRDIASAAGARVVAELGHGLNAALAQAAGSLRTRDPLLALFADLPLLCAEDVVAMAAMLAEADIVAATDNAGIGTNALLLREPGLIDYRFGRDSLALHRAEAAKHGMRFSVIRRNGLSSDLDHPADLAILAPGSLDAA